MLPFRAALLSSVYSAGGGGVSVNTSTATATAATTMDISVPSGAVEGDILLVQLSLDGLTGDNPEPTVAGCRRMWKTESVAGQPPTYFFTRKLEAGDISGTLEAAWPASGYASAVAAAVSNAGIIDFLTKNATQATSLPHVSANVTDDEALILLFLSHRTPSDSTTEPAGTNIEDETGSGLHASSVRQRLASITQASAGAMPAHTWDAPDNSNASMIAVALRNLFTPATSSGIEFVGQATLTWDGVADEFIINLNDLSGGSGENVQPGDLIIFGQAAPINSATDYSALLLSPGFTQAAYVQSDDSVDQNLSVQYRIADETDGFIRIRGGPSASFGNAVIAMIFRGVDQTTPIDVAVVTASGINGGTVDPAAITPVTSGAMIAVFGCGGYIASKTFASSDLTGFTSISGDDTFDANLAAGRHAWTSGEFDPAAWTGGETSTSASWAAVTVALRPAA